MALRLTESGWWVNSSSRSAALLPAVADQLLDGLEISSQRPCRQELEVVGPVIPVLEQTLHGRRLVTLGHAKPQQPGGAVEAHRVPTPGRGGQADQSPRLSQGIDLVPMTGRLHRKGPVDGHHRAIKHLVVKQVQSVTQERKKVRRRSLGPGAPAPGGRGRAHTDVADGLAPAQLVGPRAGGVANRAGHRNHLPTRSGSRGSGRSSTS